MQYVVYESVTKIIEAGQSGDVGEVTLREAATRLADVVVVGRRPFIEQHADRYVVNVASGISTAGRNSLDVLANTPGVLVRDGAVSVMAKEVTIYIDGRPSGLSGEQLGSLLASIQGDNIARIEVITNPSSRYDAAGLGGIIDIRTKKGIQHGLNGSVDAGYRQGRRDSENVGITLGWRHKRVNMFGNYSANRSNGWFEIGQTNGTQDAAGERYLFV